MAEVKIKPFYKNIDGVLIPGMFNPERFREALNYKPTSSDVFIATYPKCGTTWMQAVAYFIFKKGKEAEIDDFKKRSPFIDRMGLESIKSMPKPGALKTHLPFTRIPYTPEAKYIYVLRNPKDCCVSMFYHTKRHPGYWQATFDDFFEIFMTGEVEYNDYFDHLDSWYPHVNDKNVFFTTYERMKEDSKDVIVKLATFLGQEYIGAIEKDNDVLNNILKFTSFEYMKNNLAQVFDQKPGKKKASIPEEYIPEEIRNEMKQELPKDVEKIMHLRKGVVGDWRAHFSEEQSERINKKFFERTQGTEILDMYKSIMQ